MHDMDDRHESNRGHMVPIGQAHEVDTALPVYQSDNFAGGWYCDALREARFGNDHSARRREIIFAVCFAESYIFEWVRSKCVEGVNDYFPPTRRKKRDPRYRRSLEKKWRQVPHELHQDGKIRRKPQLDLSGLEDLLRYRHGLIHATASRLATEAQPPETKPFPRRSDLTALSPSWAVRIVFDLVSELHDQLGEPKPEYLVEP